MLNRRIEYVFGPQKPSTGHSLGISALVSSNEVILHSQSYGTLFSGGRDGRINAWSFSPNSTHAAKVKDIHTNWVNDIVVLNSDMVVSCSADTTVKAWNLKNSSVTTLGHHGDYAQCLAKASNEQVISGGLDNKIIGWDINTVKPFFTVDIGHSIYTLSALNPQQMSNSVVSGSPDGIVRLWDTREGRCVTEFSGHTDSVRSVRVWDNDFIVSGSSDGTVKLWCLRTGRVFKTLRQFNSSVWSLTPSKNGFWAGDRNGNIYHTHQVDVEPIVVIEHALKEGGLNGLCEDTVTGNLWISSPFSPDLRCVNPRTGATTETLRGHAGLRKYRLLNDKMRALVADTNGKISMFDLVGAKPMDFERHIDPRGDMDSALDEILDEINTLDVLDNWCHVQIKTGQICVTLDSRSVNNTEVYLDGLLGHVKAIPRTPMPTPYQSPIGTPVASPVGTPQNSGFFRQGRVVSPAVSRVASSHSIGEVVQMDQKRLPLRLGTGKGPAKFFQLNEDDDNDDQKNDFNDKSKSANNGTTTTNGHEKNDSYFNARKKIESDEEPADTETNDDEIRINLGNFVLENLLRGVVDSLKHDYHNLPDVSVTTPTSPQPAADVNSNSPVDSSNGWQGKPERKRDRFFGKLLSIGKKKDESTSSTSSGSQEDTKATGSQATKLKSQQQQQSLPDSVSFHDSWTRAVADRCLQSADPESPTPDVLSRRAKLVITEIAPGAGVPTEIYSTTVGQLIYNHAEITKIVQLLPGWVGDAVLLGKLNLRQPSKIGFSVEPANAELPVLTSETSRLMAISMLRARKIMSYIIGQLQQKGILTSKASTYPPEELIQLTCQGNELTALTTLATIRTRIWRKGGDVNLIYDIKKHI